MSEKNETRLRRTLLFVPGADPKRFSKAIESGADTILFDLEDSVSIELKVEARKNVVGELQNRSNQNVELAVRINAPSTPYFQEDLEEVVKAGADAILIPKSENPGVLNSIAKDILEKSGKDIKVLALVETALGVTQVNSIASLESKIDAICFGHADFSLDMGLTNSDASKGVIYHARCSIAIAARAYKISPIDNVCLAVKDEEAFRQDVAIGISLGFEGKLCIHPTQARIANEMYTPTDDQIGYANRVLDGWNKAQLEGKGVFTLDNKMVDAPIVALQNKILNRAKKAGKIL
ncbi:MAG: CoA ester lyase [Leptospiraceae bacterium]|nr:CoA ester lyase [Leptospiraceae bacterium]